MMRKCERCAELASNSRHDHASGTLITRPSAKCAMISSAVTRTSSIRGSLLATVFIPCLQNDRAMRLNDSTNHVQLVGAETMIASQPQRLKPEFAGLPFTLHMDVR